MKDRDTSPEREAQIRSLLAPDRYLVDRALVADLLAMLDEARRQHDEAIEPLATSLALSDGHFQRLTLRAETAEATLAALREAVLDVRGGIDISDQGSVGLWFAVVNDLDTVLADTVAAARAHDARVSADLLKKVRTAADAYECDEDHDESGRLCPKRWLGEILNEIERGAT